MRAIALVYYLAGTLSLVSAVIYVVRDESGVDHSRRVVFLVLLGIAMLVIGRLRSRFP